MIFTKSEIVKLVNTRRTPIKEALRELANKSLVVLSRVGVLIQEINATTKLTL